jgi:hypothetical protein
VVEERVVKEGARKPRRLRRELPPLTLLAAALVRGRDGMGYGLYISGKRD